MVWSSTVVYCQFHARTHHSYEGQSCVCEMKCVDGEVREDDGVGML